MFFKKSTIKNSHQKTGRVTFILFVSPRIHAVNSISYLETTVATMPGEFRFKTAQETDPETLGFTTHWSYTYSTRRPFPTSLYPTFACLTHGQLWERTSAPNARDHPKHKPGRSLLQRKTAKRPVITICFGVMSAYMPIFLAISLLSLSVQSVCLSVCLYSMHSNLAAELQLPATIGSEQLEASPMALLLHMCWFSIWNCFPFSSWCSSTSTLRLAPV